MRTDASRACCGRLAREAFTLVELLVVIGIIGILASMLLPTFNRSNQKARITQCLSNLKQIGAGIAMYSHDSGDRFPGSTAAQPDGHRAPTWFAIGGKETSNPRVEDFEVPLASTRPLYPYAKLSEAFRCPEDRGFLKLIHTEPAIYLRPRSWDIAGCSYLYNIGNYGTRLRVVKGSELPSAKVEMVTDPSRFIAMYEPPARSFTILVNNRPLFLFQHWHYTPAPRDPHAMPNEAEVTEINLPKDGRKFVSPILFVDGHAKTHDFTENIKADPHFAYESTKDWIWYKPIETNPGDPAPTHQSP